MEDRHYILSDVARILGKKPHQVTYALTSRAVPEPEQRVASRRLFSRDDIVRLARHFKVAPKWSVLEVVGNGAKDEASHGLVLRLPFEVVSTGETGHEIKDADGVVFGWTSDRAKAMVVAGLLEAAARG